jgi:predicted Fe-Mo cluster-binding NifX family protein
MVYDIEKEQFTAIANTGKESAHGAGTGSVQELIKHHVDTVIANRVGPKAFTAMQQAGVKMMLCSEGTTIEMALKKYLDHELQEITAPGN